MICHVMSNTHKSSISIIYGLLYYGLPWPRCWQQVWKGTEPLWLSGWCSPAGCPAGTGYGQMAKKQKQIKFAWLCYLVITRPSYYRCTRNEENDRHSPITLYLVNGTDNIIPFIPRIAPHLSSIEALEKYDPDRPDVHLIGDLWRLFTHHKTLRG